MKTYDLSTLEGIKAFRKAKRDQENRCWRKSNAREHLAHAVTVAEEAGLKLATKPGPLPHYERASDAGGTATALAAKALRLIGEHDRICDTTIHFQSPDTGEFEEWGNHRMDELIKAECPWACPDSESDCGFVYVAAHRATEMLDWLRAKGCEDESLDSYTLTEEELADGDEPILNL